MLPTTYYCLLFWWYTWDIMGQFPILLPVDFINCSWSAGFLKHQQFQPGRFSKKAHAMLLLVLPSWVDTRWPAPVAAIRHKTWTWCRRDGLGGGWQRWFGQNFWGIAKGGHYRKTRNTSKVFLHQCFLLKYISTYFSSVCMISMHIFGQLPNPVSSQLHTIVTQEKKKHKNPWEPRFFDLRSWCVFLGAPKKQLAFPCNGDRVYGFMLNHDHVTFFFWWMVKLHYTLENYYVP